MKLVLAALLLLSLLTQGDPIIQPELKVSKDLSAWDLDGNGSWQIANDSLQLVKAGVPSGPIRRPAALAILKSEPFLKVGLEVEARSNAPVDVVRRDIDLVVGYESPRRFYYVHLSAVTDDVHNGIFIVDGTDRKRIDSGKGIAKMTDQQWHKLRVLRDGETGTIEVFFDDLKEPILSAVDTTIKAGRVGVGSFDDTAEFRQIKAVGKTWCPCDGE